MFPLICTGATRTADAKELLYARQKIVTCAKAFKLQAIDMVHIDLKGLFVLFNIGQNPSLDFRNILFKPVIDR